MKSVFGPEKIAVSLYPASAQLSVEGTMRSIAQRAKDAILEEPRATGPKMGTIDPGTVSVAIGLCIAGRRVSVMVNGKFRASLVVLRPAVIHYSKKAATYPQVISRKMIKTAMINANARASPFQVESGG
jgi:hypothetical protein